MEVKIIDFMKQKDMSNFYSMLNYTCMLHIKCKIITSKREFLKTDLVEAQCMHCQTYFFRLITSFMSWPQQSFFPYNNPADIRLCMPWPE